MVNPSEMIESFYLHGRQHNPTLDVKVVLNNDIIDKHLSTKDHYLRKFIPEDLNPNRIYTMTLFYKFNGQYNKSKLIDLLIFVEEDNLNIRKVHFFKFEKSKYIKECHDFILIGFSKKKIDIHDSLYKIYDFQISIDKSTSSVNDKLSRDRSELQVSIGSRDYINVKKELDKLFSKYVYTIKNLESDECSVDRHYNIVDSQPRNKILIEVNIEKKRKMSERIYNYFHTIFT